MDSTLDATETAVYAAVGALAKSATPAGPFSYVGRWTGEVRERMGVLTLEREAAGRNPSLLLQWEGEDALNSWEGLEGSGSVETTGTITLVAWVVVHDPRGSREITKGTTGARGALYLVDRVIAALNGLRVTTAGVNALYRDTTLRYRRHRTRPADPNTAHVTEVRFEALRSVPTVADTETTRTLTEMHGDVNSDGNPDNPLNRFDADTT